MKITLLTLLSLIALVSPCLSLAAEPVINIHCDRTSCLSDIDVSADQQLQWAPGLNFSRTVKIYNDTSIQKTITTGAHEVTSQGLASGALAASWKNGSHKVLWQGGLLDLSKAVSLGTIPAQQSRVYYFSAGFNSELDNSTQGARATFRPWLTITDVAQTTSTNNPNPSNPSNHPNATSPKPASFGHVLGESLSFRLPNLSLSNIRKQTIQPIGKNTTQLVTAARQQTWLGWLVLFLELLALRPWFVDWKRWQEIGLVGAISASAVWVVSGDFILISLSVTLAAVYWAVFSWKIVAKAWDGDL